MPSTGSSSPSDVTNGVSHEQRNINLSIDIDVGRDFDVEIDIRSTSTTSSHTRRDGAAHRKHERSRAQWVRIEQ